MLKILFNFINLTTHSLLFIYCKQYQMGFTYLDVQSINYIKSFESSKSIIHLDFY